MRSPTASELELLTELFSKAGIDVSVAALEVEEMDDGGMGSLKLSPLHESQAFGSAAAEREDSDMDGKPYVATLYLGTNGEPYELDVFKSDFSPTQVLRQDS